MSLSTGDAPAGVVLTSRRRGILEITLNRPRVRNAVNREVAYALAAALDELDGDRDLRVAIITGAGGCFSAGMDLQALTEGESAWIADRGFAGLSKRPPKKPLIAAIEGFAVAGGLEIVLACDLIVASSDAYLSLPEVGRCLVPVGGGISRLAARLPEGVAREMVLTGDRLQATRAAELGLVNRLASPGQALDVARELASRIAENAPLAIAAAKRVFDESPSWPREELWTRQEAIGRAIEATDDAREGSLAFLQKRKPNWTGS